MNGGLMLVVRWGLGIAIVLSLAACGGGGGGGGDSQFTVTATAGAGGAISPANRTLERGATTTFTVTAESGWGVESVDGCGGSLSGTTYTTAPITGPCTVSATFGSLLPEIPVLTLTPQAIKSFRFDWPASNRATEYRLLENPDGISGFTPVASLSGDARAHELYIFLPERVNARYILQACNEFGCTDSSTVFVTGSLAEAVGYFKGANPVADGVRGFGFSVALSNDGNTMAVGSPRDKNAGQDFAFGAVYMFARHDGRWIQQARLIPEPATSGRFGHAVALSMDGNTLAVGDPEGPDGGRVFVFWRDQCPTCPNAGWRLRPSGLLSGQAVAPTYQFPTSFGFSVALSERGDRLVVGAPFFPPFATSQQSAGRAWLFRQVDNFEWGLVDDVRSLQPSQETWFGRTVALSGDGHMFVVGAALEDVTTDVDAGAVHVFYCPQRRYRSYPGPVEPWCDRHRLTPPNTTVNQNLGFVVAISYDGTVIAAGAPAFRGGFKAVHIFGRVPNSDPLDLAAWRREVSFQGSIDQDGFGRSVALSGDGTKLAVGAPQERGVARGIAGDATQQDLGWEGAVFLYTRTNESWSEPIYIKAPNAGLFNQQFFKAALSGDGSTLAVGAEGDRSRAMEIGGDQTDDSRFDVGAVYMY